VRRCHILRSISVPDLVSASPQGPPAYFPPGTFETAFLISSEWFSFVSSRQLLVGADLLDYAFSVFLLSFLAPSRVGLDGGLQPVPHSFGFA